MSPFPLLLRILISISLILDGTGTAVSATRMLVEHAATTHSMPVQANVKVTATRPCHQQDNRVVAAEMADAAMADMPGAAIKSSHRTTDCCRSGDCGCACLQATPASMVALTLPRAVMNHVAIASPRNPGHASPALPHLIRPPIG
jgi:hypothetical protein